MCLKCKESLQNYERSLNQHVLVYVAVVAGITSRKLIDISEPKIQNKLVHHHNNPFGP